MRKTEKQERRSREEWRGLVHAWRESGLSATVFARERGLNTAMLYYWSSELKRIEAGAKGRLLPVRVTASAVRSADLELRVGAACVRFEAGTSPAYVAALAHALLDASTR